MWIKYRPVWLGFDGTHYLCRVAGDSVIWQVTLCSCEMVPMKSYTTELFSHCFLHVCNLWCVVVWLFSVLRQASSNGVYAKHRLRGYRGIHRGGIYSSIHLYTPMIHGLTQLPVSLCSVPYVLMLERCYWGRRSANDYSILDWWWAIG